MQSYIVQNINSLYGSLTYSPVQHYPQCLAEEEYFALLRARDIGLITSVRHRMNTTSLEYIVAQRDSHGPVILSEFSSIARSLRQALHIHTYIDLEQPPVMVEIEENSWDSSCLPKSTGTLSAETRDMPNHLHPLSHAPRVYIPM